MSNMKASEAFNIANNHNQERAQSLFDYWLNTVKSEISKAAQNGRFECVIEMPVGTNTGVQQILTQKIRMALENEGYVLSYAPNETLMISWLNAKHKISL